MFMVSVAAALLLSASGQSAQSSSDDAPARVTDVVVTGQGSTSATAAGQAADDRVVCRREHVMGSNRPLRICKTQREWRRMHENSIEALDRRNQPNQSDPSIPTAG